MQNIHLKIQILEGNTLMSRFHVGFEIELPLGEGRGRLGVTVISTFL